jgi:hypothetical protein
MSVSMPVLQDMSGGEARRTDFDIQTLGGTKQYLAGYLAERKQGATRQSAEAARRRQEQVDAEQQAHNSSRRAQASAIFATLSDAERQAIEAEAHTHAAKFEGTLRSSIYEFGKIRFTIERHNDKLMTFEQWNTERQVS